MTAGSERVPSGSESTIARSSEIGLGEKFVGVKARLEVVADRDDAEVIGGVLVGLTTAKERFFRGAALYRERLSELLSRP